jgi:flagellum-specific peptidoglycan hydrolase FlgJ
MSTISPDVISAAQKAQKTWNVPASVALAQFGLESAWGTKMPAGSNNPFGMKAAGGQASVPARTREVVHGQSVYITAQFRKFADFAEAFDAHGRLIATLHCYAPAMHAWEATHDVDRFVGALAPVYATDPHYHDLIMSIIRSRNLTQYDLH